MTENRKLKIGIIGLGIGARHVASFQRVPEAQIVAMADPSPSRLGTTLETFCDYHHARPYTDGFDLMEREDLDAVSICTSPKLHRPMVEAAAKRGFQILLEKPMAGKIEDCDAIIDACKKHGVQLHMEFPMRQLRPIAELRRLIDAGALGTPFLLSAEYISGPRPGPRWVWEAGDGNSVINENTCHLIDTMRFLLGSVDRVHSEGGNFLGHGAPMPDAAAFTLHFRSGAIAAAVGGGVCTIEMGRRPRLSLYGTDGQAYVEGVRDHYYLLRWARRGESAVEYDYGEPEPVSLQPPNPRYPLVDIAIRSFITGVLEKRPPVVTAEDGRENVRISLAIIEAIQTGKTIDL